MKVPTMTIQVNMCAHTSVVSVPLLSPQSLLLLLLSTQITFQWTNCLLLAPPLKAIKYPLYLSHPYLASYTTYLSLQFSRVEEVVSVLQQITAGLAVAETVSV